MTALKKYNVLTFSNGKIREYDILPYFRDSWKEKYNKEEKDKIKSAKYESKRRQLFKTWVRGRSLYMFWARCEWEMLIANWPFGSKRLYDEMKEFLSSEYSLDNCSDSIRFDNIIMGDMQKIDVHQQIEMNLDTIVDILYKEFKLDKDVNKRRVVKKSSGDA